MVWECLQQRFTDITEDRRSLRALMVANQGDQSVSRWYNRLCELLARPSMAPIRAADPMVTNLFVMGLHESLPRRLLGKKFATPREALEAAARLEQLGYDRAAGKRQPVPGPGKGDRRSRTRFYAAQELDSSDEEAGVPEEGESDADEADALAAMQQRWPRDGRKQPKSCAQKQPPGPIPKPPKKGKAVPGKDGNTYPNKDCYKCRQWGHISAQCPTQAAQAGNV